MMNPEYSCLCIKLLVVLNNVLDSSYTRTNSNPLQVKAYEQSRLIWKHADKQC